MEKTTTIAAKGISKNYGDFKALEGIDIDIQEGEFLTLLGPSGSGKTTFLMILAGFLQQTNGQLIRNGQDISEIPAEKRNFGMVFQGYALFPHLTARQNIEYPLRIRGQGPSERKVLVDRMIDTVGLSEHADKKPSKLSGGQQQRVALARSLVFNPDILLLDEPLSALDRNMREQLRDELKHIHRESGTTFVFVTHDQSEALALSDRIAIFNQGKLIQHDTPRVIYDEPNSRFVAEFLGQINVIHLHSIRVEGNTIIGAANEVILKAPTPATFNADGDHVLAIRPEHMSISKNKPDSAQNAISAIVKDITYQGDHTNFSLIASPGIELSVSLLNSTCEQLPLIDDLLRITWSAENGRILSA